MGKQKHQTVAETLVKESTPPAPAQPRMSRREREQEQAREFHRTFIEQNGGFPIEVGEARGVTYLLPSGARIVADSFGNPRYYPVLASTRERLYYQLAYHRLRIERFDHAIGTLENIVEGQRLAQLYEEGQTDQRVMSIPTFAWNAKVYGTPPMDERADGSQVQSASSTRALALLKARRFVLAKRLDKLMQEPGAAELAPSNAIFTMRVNAIEARRGE